VTHFGPLQAVDLSSF